MYYSRTNQHLGSRGLYIVTVPEAVTDLTELAEINLSDKYLKELEWLGVKLGTGLE